MSKRVSIEEMIVEGYGAIERYLKNLGTDSPAELREALSGLLGKALPYNLGQIEMYRQHSYDVDLPETPVDSASLGDVLGFASSSLTAAVDSLGESIKEKNLEEAEEEELHEITSKMKSDIQELGELRRFG